MKFTLSWLQEQSETIASVDEATDTLADTGIEIADTVNLRPFSIKLVFRDEQHRDAGWPQVYAEI